MILDLFWMGKMKVMEHEKTMKMKKRKCVLGFLIGLTLLTNAQQQNDWPILKTYNQDHIQKIKMPVGGIGT